MLQIFFISFSCVYRMLTFLFLNRIMFWTFVRTVSLRAKFPDFSLTVWQLVTISWSMRTYLFLKWYLGKCAKIKENYVFSRIGVTFSSSRRYVKVRVGIKLVFIDSTGIIQYNKPNQTFTSELYIFHNFLGRFSLTEPSPLAGDNLFGRLRVKGTITENVLCIHGYL